MMTPDAFAHVDTWVFDLDNTLYPPSDRLFDQIEQKMRAYLMRCLSVDEARADHLRDHYWRLYGTTLAGLMAEHSIDPEPFMIDVHDIDMSHMRPDQPLKDAIAALPGRKLVYTNGSEPYARRVIEARGLSGAFDAVYGVEHANYVPKPQASAFEAVFQLAGVVPENAAMFEDDIRNLEVPHALGMQTVLVAPPIPPQPHIGFQTSDLSGFLSQVNIKAFPDAASETT